MQLLSASKPPLYVLGKGRNNLSCRQITTCKTKQGSVLAPAMLTFSKSGGSGAVKGHL